MNGKPTIVHQVNTDANDSQFQSVHAHLTRITQPKSPEYEQLPQTEPTTQPTRKHSKGDAPPKNGGYSPLLSSEFGDQSIGPEGDIFVHPPPHGTGDRTDGSSCGDGLWEPNPRAGKIDYKVFKDEED